jgi:phosphoribosylformimino-5-aminoimidazole carboxamide ribotide isomerase
MKNRSRVAAISFGCNGTEGAVQVIPVVDLKGGVVVHARRGERAAYRPIASKLAAGSLPADVVAGLMRLAPFSTLYVADLDAIAGEPPNEVEWRALARAWPALDLWIDAGFDGAAADSLPVGSPVLGSESQSGTDLGGHAQRILSLDFRGEGFVGPPALLERAELWPDRVIVMTLARVGAEQGPDLARVAGVVRRAAGRQVFAAGGVRDTDDLRALRDVGAAGALVATALHNGAIGSAALQALLPP